MNWIKDIGKYGYKGFSQYGEQGYLQYIFDSIGVKYKYLVDIGANDGTYLSNTRYFREKGWGSVLIDGKPFPGIHQHFVTKANIVEILKHYGTPEEFDLLSIDLDGVDYWILHEVLTIFKPRVIISEYNAEFTDSRAIEYDPDFIFRATDYYGYTFEAGLKLAEEFGYRVIFQNSNLNMYYLRKDEMEDPDIEINVPHPHHGWWGHGAGLNDTRGNWIMI